MTDYREETDTRKLGRIWETCQSVVERRANWLRLALGALLSLGFFWMASRGVDWAGAWRAIGEANLWLLVCAIATVVLTTWIKAYRWRLMFAPRVGGQPRLRLFKFFTVFLAGQVVNAVIPARLGELVRAYLIGESEGVGKTHAMWTVVVEKALDAMTLLVFVLALSVTVPFPGWLRKAGWTLGAGIGLCLVALGVAQGYRSRTIGLLRRWDASLPWMRRLRVYRVAMSLFESLDLLRTPKTFLGIGGCSILAFLAGVGANWLVARSLSGSRLNDPSGVVAFVQLDYPVYAWILLLAVLQISAVVPIPTTPGRIGLFHYLCVITLTIFGAEPEAALGYALVLHVVTYLPMAVGGPIGLWLETRGRGNIFARARGMTKDDWPDLARS